jgi:hypothetical protein
MPLVTLSPVSYFEMKTKAPEIAVKMIFFMQKVNLIFRFRYYFVCFHIWLVGCMLPTPKHDQFFKTSRGKGAQSAPP